MLFSLTIEKFHQGLKKKEFSLSEIIDEFLKNSEKKNQEIRAFLEFFSQETKEKVRELENKEISSLLFGTPGAIKDNILIKGKITSAASKILENYRATYDATVIKKLRKEEVIFLGRTNMDEFAMGSSCENSAFQITKNPWDLERVPGGSSGGSAAAVASGQVIWALGSDTGGSIRQPASFCGVVGLKPTYGSVSRFGLIAMASSLDQIGPITKTVKDAEILFEKIKGQDNCDSTSLDLKKFERQGKELKKIKIGFPKEYFEGLDNEVEKSIQEVIDFFKKEEFEIKEINLPHSQYALSCYYIIMPAEVSANLARFDGLRYGQRVSTEDLFSLYSQTRGNFFGREVKKRIILGTFVLSSGYYDAYYAKAQKIRTLIKEDFDKVFEKVDVILTPTSPFPPFKIGEKISQPLQMYLSDIFTVPANLTGLPSLSIPCLRLTKNNLPVGFQLIGSPFSEKDLFSLGKFYEEKTGRFEEFVKIKKNGQEIPN